MAIDHPGDDDHAGGIDDDRIPALARAGEVGTDSGDALAQTSPAAKSPTPASIEMTVPPRIRMRRPLSPAARRSRSSVASAPALP